jgi:hypothetical protein
MTPSQILLVYILLLASHGGNMLLQFVNGFSLPTSRAFNVNLQSFCKRNQLVGAVRDTNAASWDEACEKTLVIVESPAKAKTIQKFLDEKRYTVDFCAGHVRDLSKAKDAPVELRKEVVQKDLALSSATFGVRVHDGFEPVYVDMPGKADIMKRLKKAAKQCSRILLATDEDREGEAISWHLVEVLKVTETHPVLLFLHNHHQHLQLIIITSIMRFRYKLSTKSIIISVMTTK